MCRKQEEALSLYTSGSAWVSQEEELKGKLQNGMYADLAVLSDDYFNINSDEVSTITSVLTITGGEIVYAASEFKDLNPPLPEPIPIWSPVRYFGGYQSSSNR